jgi:hypothetical protein
MKTQKTGIRFTHYHSQETLRTMTRELPQGDWSWDTHGTSARLQKAAHKIAASPSCYLSDLHMQTMAVLGCGHEETCKAHLLLMVQYGY